MTKSDEPDYLDEIVALYAEKDPTIARQWAATVLVQDLRELREARGISQAQVAERLRLPEARVIELEAKPWSVSFGRIVAYAQAVGAKLSVSADELAAA